jgi:hypothetical protein
VVRCMWSSLAFHCTGCWYTGAHEIVALGHVCGFPKVARCIRSTL